MAMPNCLNPRINDLMLMLGKISLVPFSLKVRDIRIFFFRTLLMVPTVSYSDRYSFIFYKNKSSLSCDYTIYLIIYLSPYIWPSLSMITNMWNRLLKSSLRLVAQKFNLSMSANWMTPQKNGDYKSSDICTPFFMYFETRPRSTRVTLKLSFYSFVIMMLSSLRSL